MPSIEDDGRIAYGGDQEWCTNPWHRRSGCGPVAGVNLSAWYAMTRPSMRALYDGNTGVFSRDEYVKNIEAMFRFITPGFMGFPYAEKFISCYGAYAHACGVQIAGACCEKGASAEQMFDFVRGSIDHGHPVPLLILHHRAPEMADDNWHWVVISGYTEGADGRRIIASNCGDREVWDAGMLFDRSPGNVLRLVRFRGIQDS